MNSALLKVSLNTAAGMFARSESEGNRAPAREEGLPVWLVPGGTRGPAVLEAGVDVKWSYWGKNTEKHALNHLKVVDVIKE